MQGDMPSGQKRVNNMALTLQHHGVPQKDSASDPLVRPFETIAISCGVLTLIGTFFVSSVMLKGLLIGGSFFALIGALLYFGLERGGE